jgi:hypothetical protein
VPEYVKRGERLQLRNRRSFGKRPLLMARPPRPAIISPENQVLRRTSGSQSLKEGPAFVSKDNVARLPGL